MPQTGRRGITPRVMAAAVEGVARSRSGFVPVSPDLVPRSLFARRKHWAERFGTAPVLPTTRAEMDALGWDSCDVVLVTGDAYVDHPSFGMALVRPAARGAGVPGRHPRAARLAQRRAVRGARAPDGHVGRHRRQHGLDGQPLHRRPAAAARRRLHARRRGRAAPRSRRDRLRAALPGGVPRRPGRPRRHRGQPAADRPLRLLVRQGPALGAARRQGRPAGLRQRRARHRRDRAPAGRGRGGRRRSATCAARRSRARPARRPKAGPRSTRARSTRRGAPAPRVDPYADTTAERGVRAGGAPADAGAGAAGAGGRRCSGARARPIAPTRSFACPTSTR